MAPLRFEKIHGLGNDFIVVEASLFPDDLDWVRAVCDRHTGVGADGVLVVDIESPRMIVYNQDGSRPEMCGNGIRCVARYLVERHGRELELAIETDAGQKTCVVTRDAGEYLVDVDMGTPRVEGVVSLEVDGRRLDDVVLVDMGNPHAVHFGGFTLSEIDRMGGELNAGHARFPRGVNFESATVEGDEIGVVVYERGVGRTLACGTGACATAVAATTLGLVEKKSVRVRLPGGPLTIDNRDGRVWMKGPAQSVFRGEIVPGWN